ncbi:MAG: PD-(D/E)XK nuclease family protein [Bacteroidales bacterium]|nr:PD-(D/E)XK nuclease family protein [Bacteroidales bacterium]
MIPFLRQVVRHYYSAGDISRRKFIFPNRRSQVFFTKYLGEEVKASGVPVAAPGMMTINDFFYTISGFQATDRVTLLLELYDRYKELFPKAEPLDEFIFWGDVLLGDFDDVDKYLVDPARLYANIADLKAIQDTYSYLTETQRKAVERFVQHFRDSGRLTVDPDSDDPNVKERFFRIWQILLPLYRNFRKSLLDKGMSYEGMAYRSLAERIRTEAASDILHSAFGDVEEYVFVGLNALNECEKAVMRRMRDAGLAGFCWDYSSDMVRDPGNNSSFFMSANVAEFPQSFIPDPDGLPQPRIRVVSTPSSTGQVKLVPTLVDSDEYAIVLPDESLLLPLLNSIPPQINDINVTMGYPMRGTAFFDFLTLVSALQMHLRQKDGKWYFYHTQVWAVFSSGVFKEITKADEEAAGIVAKVKAGAKYYIPQEDLNGHPVFDLVFQPVVRDPKSTSSSQIREFASYQKTLISGIASYMSGNPDSALELEFARKAWNTVIQLESKELEVLPATYVRLLEQLLGPVSVPFNGEPLRGLQIMGPLETRALDFKHLVILSCNEGVFPRRSVSSSFIPPELRKGFGLPTYEYQDAIWAYYFYRMIQRAETVTLVYDSRTEGLKNGEESRYIKQLEYHYDIPLERSFVKSSAKVRPGNTDIPKTEGDVSVLKDTTLSASALKSYLDCPAKFYYSKIAGLKEETVVAEDLDAGMVGDVYHSTMQALYMGEGAMDPSYDMGDRKKNASFPGALKEIGREYIASWMKRSEDIRKRVRSLILTRLNTIEVTGRDLVTERVIVQYVLKTLQRDLELMDRLGTRSFRIIGLEKEYSMDFDGFKFIGYVDRMDSFLPGELRIVDYKTGKVEDKEVEITDENAASTVEALFGSDNSKRPKVAFQLFLYDVLTGGSPEAEGMTLVNSVYQPSRFFTEGVRNVPVSREFTRGVEERLHGLLAEMTDTEVPWRRTADSVTCSYCDFKMICGR